MTALDRPARLAPPPGLVRMRRVAAALLLLMAALFIACRAIGPVHPAIGFLRAFAEAAMVGGLADWFAVTALFRHPLGLPIPHTAIVPRNKDRIGDTLGQFLRANFLVPAVVAPRMRRADVAGSIGRWLAQPGSGGLLRQPIVPIRLRRKWYQDLRHVSFLGTEAPKARAAKTNSRFSQHGRNIGRAGVVSASRIAET